LSSTWRCDGIATARLTITTLGIGRLEVEGNVLTLLLNDKDRLRKISRLGLLVGGQICNFRVDQEDVGQVVDLRLRNVWGFKDVSVESYIPTLLGPIGIRGNIEDFGRFGVEIAVVDSKLGEDLTASRKVLEELRNA
jgi:hypothetical protein